MNTWHPLSAKVGTNFADNRRSLVGSDHGVFRRKYITLFWMQVIQFILYVDYRLYNLHNFGGGGGTKLKRNYICGYENKIM
jgi:hypothetical protein